MRTITLGMAAIALTVGGASAALADHHGGKRGPGAADTNGDGIISLAEAKAQGAKRFAKMDANGDGVINAEDREARQAERFAAMDTDGSGEVSLSEMTAAREARQAKRAERREARKARMMERFDTDGDGTLSAEERSAAREKRAAMRAERSGNRMQMRGPGQRRGGPAMRMLRQADTNKDKTVTRAEFDAAIEARFARVDADGSGTITAEERKAARQAMMERRKQMRQAR